MKSQEIKANTFYLLGTVNVCAQFHSKPSNSCFSLEVRWSPAAIGQTKSERCWDILTFNICHVQEWSWMLKCLDHGSRKIHLLRSSLGHRISQFLHWSIISVLFRDNCHFQAVLLADNLSPLLPAAHLHKLPMPLILLYVLPHDKAPKTMDPTVSIMQVESILC